MSLKLLRIFTVATLLQSCLLQAVLGGDPILCNPLVDCTLMCQYGLFTDENNCKICACNEPCKDYDCGLYEVCEVRIPYCTDQDPCPPRPTCVPKPGSSVSPTARPSTETTTRNKDICLLEPQLGLCDVVSYYWFFNVTALECQPFLWSGCGGNGNRFNGQSECLARCLPTSVVCPDVSCASPCQLQYDSKGCSVCACPGATCRDVQCGFNEECQIVDGQCSVTSQMCHPVPQCAPKTAVSSPSPPCPYIDCELLLCEYGFNVDQYGCKTCTCYDPCETFECPTGQRCMVRPNDCPEGMQCRDGPLRYCTDETPPPISRDRPSAAELMSCCVAENMSERCQPLCIPDLSVSSSIIPTLLQCAGELKTYLKCAGGGASFTSCCARKAVGPSCNEFCTGNASIDTTNLHVFTECMSYDLNDVFSCYQEGLPDIKSTVATVMPTDGVTGMTTAFRPPPDVCTQSPNSGPCDAAIERWYFNPNTLMCETFTYGGCEGNANNFLSMEDCLGACMIQIPPCPQVMCDTGCRNEVGSNGCPICVCPSQEMSSTLGMSPTMNMGSTQGMIKPSTTFPTTNLPTTPLASLYECCSNSGVNQECMPFCSFDFNFDESHIPALLACQSHLATGIECAKREKSFTQCCQAAGVTGQCLEACGASVNISDIYCLVTDHAAMLTCFAQDQSDDRCPPIRCQVACEYGSMKDVNGCDTCNCFDPCEDFVCPSGQTCMHEPYPACTGDICHIAHRGKCTGSATECPKFECSNSCSYGRAKNSDLCEVCECADPCKDVTCDAGYKCKVVNSLTCDGENCETQYVGSCAVDCQILGCMACEFGFVKDANNCDTCDCYDPCKNVTCRDHQTCVSTTIPTYVGEGSTQIKEVFIGECRDVPTSCETLMCDGDCDHGFEEDKLGCPTCDCYNPCQNVSCDTGTVCKVEPVNPSQNNGYDFKGVCKSDVECTRADCHTYCDHGFLKNSLGCETCECFDPCKGLTCTDGKKCETVYIEATTDYPYSFVGRCAPLNGCQVPMCTMYCPNGFEKDSDGCDTCKCYEPCTAVQCEAGSICKIEPTTELDSSIYAVKGVCRVECSGMLCDISCTYGNVMLTMACPLCECFDPCKDLTCGTNETCQSKQVEATEANPQSYVGVCVRNQTGCPTVMCSNYCQYGYVKSGMGCETCDCLDPCLGIKCLTGMVCEPRVDTNCVSTVCTKTAFAVCVPPPRPCAQQQMADYEKYYPFDQNTVVPEINCDVEGYYKPLQCVSDDLCRCSAPNGLSKMDGLQRHQAIELCYPNDKIIGTMKMYTDIENIKPGYGSIFKQNISKQIADMFGMDDSNVTVIEYYSGSIMVNYLASVNNKFLMDNAWNKLQMLQSTNQMVPIEYEGEHYHATMESFQRHGPYNQYSTPQPQPSQPQPSRPQPVKDDGLTRAELLAIVIVVPIVGALLLSLLIAFIIFKLYKREKPLISDSVRSSMSFDNIIDEKGGRPKSGYENPSYDTSKARPVSGTFSNSVTTA